MAKVTIGGEVFDWDPTRQPLNEALVIENTLKCTYVKWEEDMRAGSARAMCGFIWRVWHRAGRDVSLEDILAGKVDVDLNEIDIEPDGDEEAAEGDPTGPPPEALSTTGSGTSVSSRKSSASGPGKSRS